MFTFILERVLRYLVRVFLMDADRPPTPSPSLLRRCLVVDGKQPSGKTTGKVLYDSAVQKLLDEVGLSLLDAANNLKSEWHNITRPEELAAQARAASESGFPAQAAAKRPLLSPNLKGLHHPTSSWRLGNGVGNMQT
jgi:hypothetical protein